MADLEEQFEFYYHKMRENDHQIAKRINVKPYVIREIRLNKGLPKLSTKGRSKRTLPDTLCWDCKNATAKCKWSQTLQPDLENWEEYKETELKNSIGEIGGAAAYSITKSYCVIKCKLFESDI